MLIGVDGNEANVVNRVGVNTYAFEVIKNIKHLQDQGEVNHRLIVYLKDNPLPDMPKESEIFKYKVLSGGSFWILTRLTPYLFTTSQKPDVFFSPSHYTPLFSAIPKVCSIMDLGYLDFTEQFSFRTFWQLKYWTANSLSTSKYIIAISNMTKKDIVRHYPETEGKVRVTYLGYNNNQFDLDVSDFRVDKVKKLYSIVSDYVLYLGTLKPSKNIEHLIEAFYQLLDEMPEVGLVIAGKKGWYYENIFKMVKDLALDDKVVFTDFVPEKDKPSLIKGAKVFVIPSYWEGFGLDALSAMACGTPVVASNVGSLPEVVGEAGILVNPNNADSIKDGILEVLKADKKKYNRMVESGKLQAREFSWKSCARETVKILEDAKR